MARHRRRRTLRKHGVPMEGIERVVAAGGDRDRPLSEPSAGEWESGAVSLDPYWRHRGLLRQELDDLYARFCEHLPSELRACARDLPYRLRMAPGQGTPWSEAFGHEATF